MRTIAELWEIHTKGTYMKGAKPLSDDEARTLLNYARDGVTILRMLQEPAYGLMLIDMAAEQERLEHMLEERRSSR